MADPSPVARNERLLKFFEIIGKWDLDTWVQWLGDWGISRALIVTIFFFGLIGVLANMVPNLGLFTFQWLVGTSPIWLPVALGVSAWKSWKLYILSNFLAKSKYVMLEMKVPRDITRSPRAMELALTALWVSSGETQFILRHWRGQVRPFYSFEIASFGGEVHFYVWCRESDKVVIEHALYAYYPEIELHEVEDYATKFRYDASKYAAFATDHVLEKTDAYPIKTYVDFELDKDPKEEFKIDPLAGVLEYMSGLKPQEQAWVQIMITLNNDKRQKKHGFGTESRWEGMIRDEVEAIRRAASEQEEKDPKTGEIKKKIGFPRPTFSQQEAMKTMERHLGKLVFNVGVRGVYLAEKKYFAGSSYNGVRWLWRPFNNPGFLNSLRPKNWTNTFDYPWQDFNNYRQELYTRRFLDAYRRRSYFYAPWTSPYYMMSVESLATMWHPPSRSVSAPGLERIPAKKAEPPANLPR
jgi:hypothetical protein